MDPGPLEGLRKTKCTRELVGASFDSAFYLETYPQIAGYTDPLEHFLHVGWVQGRDPSPYFSVFRYLLQHDDVLFRRLNPFVHYLKVGREQGKEVFDHTLDRNVYLPLDAKVAELLPLWFDEEYYRDLNPELVGAPCLLTQFLVLGWAEGRDPSAKFSVHKYLWKYSDVALAGINPLIHFLQTRGAEEREAIPAEGSRTTLPRNLSNLEWLERVKQEFDPEFYATMYPSTRGLANPFDHYRTTGWLEGLDPSPRFSNRKYLEYHRDVLSDGVEPLYHYCRWGVFEGRKTFPSDAVPEAAQVTRRMEPTEEDGVIRAEFDAAFYRDTYPELAGIDELFEHYMTEGWREGRNPSADFDTRFYLRREGDIREAGINPFRHFVLHGRREGRHGCPKIPRVRELKTYPRVTAIVPNYNHAKFLPERLRSILAQGYPDLEIIILDDCSTDDSRQVIREFAEHYAGECRLVFNEINSGNVFAQWRRGISMATGELLWICESDDTCDDRFLHQMVYLFEDPSVTLAFGDIQFIDTDGNTIRGMTDFREAVAPGIWNTVNLMPASKWFSGPLAVRNLIANVGGAVFRKTRVKPAIWATVGSFRVAGDWLFYLEIAGGGQIAYAPDAKAYFRQHAANTSVAAFQNGWFYEELGRFHCLLRERWEVPPDVTFRFFQTIMELFQSSTLSGTRDITRYVSFDRLIQTQRTSQHLAVSFLNFSVGGGEIFPIEVLNVLHRRGHLVSAVVQTLEADNDFVRDRLDRGVPIYAASQSALTGPELARDAGFDVIHSHNIWSEFFFLGGERDTKLRYIVTHHGSYEVSFVRKEQIQSFFDRITWVYIADRNLEKFREYGFDTTSFRLIPNGMVRRISANAVSRADLGVSEAAIVFMFAARSHPQKGWQQAAEAFDRLSRECECDAVLLMAGDGQEVERVRERFGTNEKIKLLGFRSDVDDLLELCNFTLLPSRFAGESMPLVVIQSILARVPVISTDIGCIAEMLLGKEGAVGVAIAPDPQDEIFVCDLMLEMRAAVDGGLTVSAAAFAAAGARFSIESCVDEYEKLYR